MANGATNVNPPANPSVNPPQTLTVEEFDRLRASLKHINLKARRLQTSTLEEVALRELFRKVDPLIDLVLVDKSAFGRSWRSSRSSEILNVRSYLRNRPDTSGFEPVAQNELKAILQTVDQIDTEIGASNWTTVQKLCQQLVEQIYLAETECRNVTERELREITTITENL